MQRDTSCAAGSNQPSTSFAPLAGTKRDASDCSCSEAESRKRHCVSADVQSAAASAHHEAQSCAFVVSNHEARDMDTSDVDGCDRPSNRDECDGSSAASVSSVDNDDDSDDDDDDDDEAQMQHVMDQHRQWVSIAILVQILCLTVLALHKCFRLRHLESGWQSCDNTSLTALAAYLSLHSDLQADCRPGAGMKLKTCVLVCRQDITMPARCLTPWQI